MKHGLPHVSLMKDDPKELGTPFRWLISHDMKIDAPAPVSDAINHPNAPLVVEREEELPLPSVTTMKARHREIAPTTKVPVEGLYISLDDAARLEEMLWTPMVTRDGKLEPNDLQDDPRLRFAGFQHLCPIWKEPIGGVEMLKKSLDWCNERKIWVRGLFPVVSISRSDRTHVIRLGLVGELIYVRVGSKSLQGSLMPVNRTRVSKIDLAGTYAVMRSLVKMYRESRCAQMPPFTAEILIPLIELDRLPDFTRMARVGEFREGAFAGLLEVELQDTPLGLAGRRTPRV